jgi:hypothetical protein
MEKYINKYLLIGVIIALLIIACFFLLPGTGSQLPTDAFKI